MEEWLHNNQDDNKKKKNKRDSAFIQSMNMSVTRLAILFLLLNLFQTQTITQLSNNDNFSSSYVTSSMSGGGKIFIRGSGFDADTYDNQVFIGSHLCEIDNYYTSENLLVCALPEGYYSPETYQVSVKVKGVTFTCSTNCSLTISFSHTPNFHSIYPQSTFPGENLNVYGVHRANDYSEIQFLKINGRNCILDDDQIENGEISFWSYKTISCQLPEDLEPGDHKFTMVAKVGTGFASTTTSATGYKVGSESETYNVRIHPKITGISPSEGYVNGQEIEISGVGFGEDMGEIDVEIAGEICTVSSVQDDKIVCSFENISINPAKQIWKGNTGLIMQNFPHNTSFANLYTMYSDMNDAHNTSGSVDATTILSLEDHVSGNYMIKRMFGVFTATESGTYRFYTSSDDDSELRISNNPIDPNADYDESTFATLCISTYANHFRNFYQESSQICDINLNGGQDYFFVFLFKELYGDAHFSVAVEVPNSDSTKPNQLSKIQEITIDNTPVREVIEIVINNATEGTYKVYFPEMVNVEDSNGVVSSVKQYNKKSNEIPFDATDSQFRDAIANPTGWWHLSVTRDTLDTNGNITADPSLITGYKYTLTFDRHRNLTLEPFIDTSSLLPGSVTTSSTIIQAPSDKVRGNFKLQYGSHITGNIKYNEWSGTVSLILESIEPLHKGVTVFETGVSDDGKAWKIILDSINGAGEDLTIAENNLTGGVSGNPNISINTNYRANSTNLFYLPVPSEFISTFHSKPQITVKRGNIGAGCPAQNCDFDFISSSDIPNIESFDISSNPISITLSAGHDTKNGGELLTDSNNLSISFGHSECAISSVALPTIQCNLPLDSNTELGYEAGDNYPIVKVSGKGILSNSAAIDSSTPLVTLVSPNDGSEGGGLEITISGKRFATDTSRIQVTIGDNECKIISTSLNEIKCITPPKNPTGDNLLKVVVNSKEWLDTVGTRLYDYNLAKTPTITSIDKPIASPIIKQDLVLSGANFGTVKADLKVMLVPADPTSGLHEQECFLNNTVVYDNIMACTLSGGKSGSYKIQMYRENYGYAIGNPATALDFKYQINLISISESTGSTEGGHLVILTGENFSTIDSDNQVIFGESSSISSTCEIQSSTSTEIRCIIPKLSEIPDDPLAVRVLGKLTEESVCTGTCSYHPMTASTPEVTNISSNTGVSGDVITVTGTNLDSVRGTREIKIGTVDALNITAGNATSFTFEIPPSSEPQGEISIVIGGRGKAKLDGSVNTLFTNTFQVTSVSPLTGSKAGNKFTILGNGFHVEKDLIRVEVGSENCFIESVTPVQIECWVYNANFGDNSVQTVNVLNVTKSEDGTETSITRTCASCEYTVSASSPAISSISSQNLSDNANITFTIDGTDLRSDIPNTSIELISNDREMFYNLRASGSLVAGSGANDVDITVTNTSKGTYDIAYFITNVGFAVSNNTLDISTSDISQSNSPLSLNGGASYVISGKGFLPNEYKDKYRVEICNRKCVVTASSRTQLTCKTPKFNTVSIQNSLNMDTPSVLESGTPISSNPSGDIPINDGSPQTGFSASSSSCHLGYDFGEGLQAQISKIRIFPTLATNEKDLIGSILEGSNTGGSDASEWTQLVEIDYNFVENWNSYFPETGTTWDYRFIRLRNSNYCRIGEFEVTGIILNNVPSANSTSHSCDVLVYEEDTLLSTLNNAAEYREDRTPIITSISPSIGSTAGGDQITITGTNLDVNGSVLIDTVECLILTGSSSPTSIVCDTGVSPGLIEPSFEVYHGSSGLAIDRTEQGFLYADRWSDTATWGGESLPREGDLVVVPVGMTLYVDVSTPVLASVIVRGSLIFADESDMTFDTHFLMVIDGKLQIGTPDNRYQHKLVITLHGSRTSAMFPGFGNKNIMVQGGSVDIHGKERDVTWTELDQSAVEGDNTITLMRTVDWQVGEEIVIAPTSRNRDEVEERQIAGISNASGKTVITLDSPLSHRHFAGVLDFDGRSTDIRAEVGLLSRNVVVQGDSNSVKDMYGSHIMLRGKEGKVVGRFSYFETRHAGQAFQMGRYPIHFHMIGNVIGSYIEGCAVHHTFNRATTIHGVHYLQIRNNVYYRHMGHALFVEDSIESNNLVENNLVIHISPSTALLASDLKPAGAWITRPKNFFRGNHIVGSSHFSFWYDLPNNPTGPSATSAICPVGEPLGQFDHNVGHSSGIGLRVYPQFKPRTNPCGTLKNMSLDDPFEENEPVPAIFKHNTMYSNGNGIFHRNIGAVQHIDLRLYGNGTNIVISEPDNARDSEPRIGGSLIVGSSALTDFHGTSNGTLMQTARKDGFLIKDTSIHNFTTGALFTTCNGCGDETHRDFGGRRTTFTNLSFHNVTTQLAISYRDAEKDKDIFYDTDGSLISHITGKPSTGGWITPYNDHLDIPECERNTDICNVDCAVCDGSISILRMEIVVENNFDQFNGQQIKIFNIGGNKLKSPPVEFGTDLTDDSLFGVHDFRNVHLTMGFRGFTFNVATGYDYNLHWGTGIDWLELEIRNNVYWKPYHNMIFHFNNTEQRELMRMSIDETMTLAEKESQNPQLASDRYLNRSIDNKFEELSNVDTFGNYFYNNITQTAQIKVDGTTRGYIRPVGVYCEETCPPPEEGAPIEQRIRLWSNPLDWEGNEPVAGEDVEILPGWNMFVDVETEEMKVVTINGRLSFSNMFDKGVLKAKVVDIGQFGQFYAGDEDSPFEKEGKVILTGVFSDPTYQVGLGIAPSAKSIIVRGKMKFFGIVKTPNWAFLKESISPGDTVLKLDIPDTITLNWEIGDRIVIGSSSTHVEQKEIGEIQDIDIAAGQITLKDQVSHFHYGAENALEVTEIGKTLDMRTEIGVLDRNLVIEGSDEDNWGCTVLVPQYDYIGGDQPVNIQGELTMDGVLMERCGQRDAEKGAINTRELRTDSTTQSITNCVIANSLGWGASLENSAAITFKSNIIFNARKYGLHMGAVSSSMIEDNLIIGVRERENYSNDESFDIITGMYFEDTETLETRNTVIRNNRVSSAVWFSYVVPGYDCGHDSDPNFFNNVAHSSKAGWFPSTFNGAINCQKFSDFIGFKNMEQGFVNRIDGGEIRVSNMVLADNNNSIAVNGGNSGGWYQEITFDNLVIYGRALEDCTECYSNDNNCAHNGMYSSIFNEEPYDFNFEQERLPLHNSTSAFYNQASLNRISNVHFKNFQENYSCNEKHKVFRLNNFYQDGVPSIYISDVNLNNVDHNSKFFFANHTRHANPVPFCGKRDCTGIYNTPIFDLTGSFFDKPLHFFGHNLGAGKDGDCDFYAAWNGHSCNPVYAQLQMFKPDASGGRDSIVSPITISRNDYSDDFVEELKFRHEIDSESKFAALVKLNQEHKIDFLQTMPTGMRYKLVSPLENAADYSIIRVYSEDPSAMFIERNGSRINNLILNPGEEPNFANADKVCGQNYYLPDTRELIFIITGERDCDLLVKHINSIKLSARMDIDPSEFYSEIGATTFEDRVAAMLGISSDRIRIVSIKKGSTIVEMITEREVDIENETQSYDEIKNDLDDIYAKFKSGIESGVVDLGAPVLDIDAKVGISGSDILDPCVITNTCPPPSDNPDTTDLSDPQTANIDENIRNDIKIALAVSIPLIILFILVISYVFYVYYKNKRNSESNISIGINTIIKSNPENGEIIFEDLPEEKQEKKRKRKRSQHRLEKSVQSQNILNAISEKDEEYGVNSNASSKQNVYLFGKA